MADTANTHPHLELIRERPVTERRPQSGFSQTDAPDDPQGHGLNLRSRLGYARAAAANDIGGYDERLLIKITLARKVSPEEISKASCGVEIVSQEDDTLILAFATETQLEEFSAKLASLAVGEKVTYKNLLYALTDFDRWTPEDRTGWALGRFGFPDVDTFVIDAELWPLYRRQDANRLGDAFADWIEANSGEVLDSVRQAYLTIYRIRCCRALAEDLLNHRDVRNLDLPPRIGLEPTLLLTDVQRLEDVPNPPSNAPGVVVLDSGLVAGHPVLAPAVGDVQSFLKGTSAADDHGHGTKVSGIALYDDIAECLRNRRFVPQLRIFSGRVLDENNRGDTDLIHNQIERAVVYFVENYDCRVFNLSYADCNKPYQGRHVSGLAVTLDALCREHNVLFVVPTGNFEGDEEGPNNWLDEYPSYLKGSSSVLLDPAPALNAITVGSISRYERSARWPDDPGYPAIARSHQPSPFTRHGPSVNGAIKPDLVDFGGNWIVDLRTGGSLMYGQNGGGELSTSREFATGRPFCEDAGTSFAAPRIANAVAGLLAELPNASVDLCRALLITHARVPKACDNLFSGAQSYQTSASAGRTTDLWR
ncbi:MAG: S8 family peptidase, partial [Gemmatimonadetes bacterium]|nr:S8 family peptidase [Gemmatimonadota bacterium]